MKAEHVLIRHIKMPSLLYIYMTKEYIFIYQISSHYHSLFFIFLNNYITEP